MPSFFHDIAKSAQSFINSAHFNSSVAFIVFTFTVGFLVPPFLFLLVQRLLRSSRRPARVDCWFCQTWQEVPRSELSGWTCQHCQQYNGFSQDGGYNKVVPGQAVGSASNGSKVCPTRRSPSNFSSHSDVLCRSCSDNQQLKVQQLARFEPLIEDNYDSELAIFRARLERSLALCSSCESRSRSLIRRCDRRVLPTFVEWQRVSGGRRSDVRNLPSQRSSWRFFTSPLLLLLGVLLTLSELGACLLLLLPSPSHARESAWSCAVVQALRAATAFYLAAPDTRWVAFAALCWLPALLWTLVGAPHPLRVAGIVVFVGVRILLRVRRTSAPRQHTKKEKKVVEMVDEEEEAPVPPSTPLHHQFHGLNVVPPPSSVSSWQTAAASAVSQPLIRPSRLGLSLAPSISSQVSSPRPSHAANGVRYPVSTSPPPSCCASGDNESVQTPAPCVAAPRPLWRRVVVGLALGANGAMLFYCVLLPACGWLVEMVRAWRVG